MNLVNAMKKLSENKKLAESDEALINLYKKYLGDVSDIVLKDYNTLHDIYGEKACIDGLGREGTGKHRSYERANITVTIDNVIVNISYNEQGDKIIMGSTNDCEGKLVINDFGTVNEVASKIK